MKRFVISVFVLAALSALPSCKKCYTCSNLPAGFTVSDACSGDVGYDLAESFCTSSGGTWTVK